MTEWVIGKSYSGAEIDDAPAGAIAMDWDGRYGYRSESRFWIGGMWTPHKDAKGAYVLVNLPPYATVEEGGVYPLDMLRGLPDGSVLCADDKKNCVSVRCGDDWVGGDVPGGRDKAPFRVLRINGGFVSAGEWTVGRIYTGAELEKAPVGTIVGAPTGGGWSCKNDDDGEWVGCIDAPDFLPEEEFEILALPPYKAPQVGGIYPAYMLRDLPDGALLDGFRETDKTIKHDGEWIGYATEALWPKSYVPFRVLKLPTLVGQLFTGEQLREHMVKGLVVEDDDGETATFNGSYWAGDGYWPTLQPGKFFRVLSMGGGDAE